MYFAVIGDIVHSRQLQDRYVAQEQLKDILSRFNREYHKMIASNFTITLGDEFQGLLSDGAKLIEILDRLKYLMDPVDLRVGIGLGGISTAIDQAISIGADGPAFWHAREAIEAIHKDNAYGVAKVRAVSNDHKTIMDLLNESMTLCDFVESQWSSVQALFMRTYILTYGYRTDIPQTDLAEQFKVSKQAMNTRIQAMGFYTYLRLKQSIAGVLQEAGGWT